MAVVADGMGGHACGDVAAEVVARSVVGHVCEAGAESDPENLLREAFAFANERVELKRIALGVRVMGAVAVAALVSESSAWFAWLGDSRGCVVRDGCVAMRTTDHSLVDDFRQMRTLSAAEENRYSSAVLRAVMGKAVPDEASVAHTELMPGDAVILCSDGLHRNVADLAALPSDSSKLESFLDGRADKWDDNYTLIRIII